MDNTAVMSKSSQDGLTVKVYPADGSVLLAFDLDPSLTANLAGFAVKCSPPPGTGQPYYLNNRLDFTTPVTNQTQAGQEPFVSTLQAPFQMFRWAFFPHDIFPGPYTFTVTAMQFANGGLVPGPSTSVSTAIGLVQSGLMQVGFTRGFLSSQAYTDKFHNAPIEPSPKRFGFDTTPYQSQYQWLGLHAREMVFDFLQDCLTDMATDPTVKVHLFAFDLDEPDVINMLVQMKSNLSAVLDNSPDHTKPGALEIQAAQTLAQSAGAANIKQGHFNRFSHSKVLIKIKNGQPVRVLAGSANFSVRGLYVQANNVFIFDSPEVAALYEQAFQAAFTDMSGFRKAAISKQWFDIPAEHGAPYSFCFSPHADDNLSIKRVSSAIEQAQSSVLFAVMELDGGGSILTDLVALSSTRDPNTAPTFPRPDLFSYGVTQSISGIKLYKPGAPDGILTNFSALDKQVPPPFNKEVTGGVGQVIHHKFVVVDFNGPNACVFAGSSNLSSGGETDNGDNLVAIYDPAVVQAYAVEAIRLVDHYHYRTIQNAATTAKPLLLQGPVTDGTEWWRPYYDPTSIRCLERTLFLE